MTDGVEVHTRELLPWETLGAVCHWEQCDERGAGMAVVYADGVKRFEVTFCKTHVVDVGAQKFNSVLWGPFSKPIFRWVEK